MSHPSAAVYEKPHAGERMGLMAYGPDKEKTALHIACKAAFCLYFSFVRQGVRHCVVPFQDKVLIEPSKCIFRRVRVDIDIGAGHIGSRSAIASIT